MAMKLLEVEQRYALSGRSPSAIAARLKDLGFVEQSLISQRDTYFTSRHKDFIASEECLRVREVDARAELTWKPPSTDEMRGATAFWKEEIDVDVTGQVDDVLRMLRMLDFVEYVVVAKDRRVFVLPDGVEVAIDSVQGVGSFVELEIKAEDPGPALARLQQLADQLELDPAWVSKVPYRDLVKTALGSREA
jgi:adenylate cyclase class 2